MAKGCLAGGLAASFGVESAGLSQLSIVAFNFTLQAVGLVCMLVVCWTSVKPTMYFKEENVIVPVAVQLRKTSDIVGLESDGATAVEPKIQASSKDKIQEVSIDPASDK